MDNAALPLLASARTGFLRLLREIRRNKSAYFFMLPIFLFLTIFLIVPAVQAIYLGFFRFDISTQKVFVGLENFAKLFRERAFLMALRNTFLLMLGIVPLSLMLSLVIAVALNDSCRLVKAFARGAFYLPIVVSGVTLSLIWKFIYDPVIGIANHLLGMLGLERVIWLGSTRSAMPAIMAVVFSYSLGRPVILFMAALAGIPLTYYEAARIDGAGRIRQFFSITLPLLKPTTLYLLVQGTISVFQTFVIIKLLTTGGPNNATQTLSYLLYEKAFVSGDYGTACAIGVVLFFIVTCIAVIQYRWLSNDIEY